MMIIKIAIVEDDINQARLLESHLTNYSAEKGLSFNIVHFSQAVALLENYESNFDIIFMDIQLPYMNGMDAARSIRLLDKKVILIFITNLTQYAIQGYEVEALDYMLKPVEYFDFALKMSRAMQRLNDNPKDEILIPSDKGMLKVSPKSIRYVETEGHHVIYHSVENSFRQYATISSIEKKMHGYDFFRCNNCYLVNLAYVQRVHGYTVTLDGGVELRISQPRKKAFVNKLMEYVREKDE
ncbi:response regulator transcription factor [Paenibacillus sp. SZ31]|uniref:LytR/AlgR family response regulator transcription factor n=1 Tax=unclassified Paenibacillus TaxID=185978 RepID=UPI00146C60F8|nr:LytTR family DNA-binding domain-containing protein [Paenibacillus sp. SZ31]NMI05725.1 response regulator transcription factor [Paenibacillus sp. SZ31]